MKRLYWEHINATLLIREDSILHLFLTMIRERFRGTPDPVPAGAVRQAPAEPAHARANQTRFHVDFEFTASSLRAQASVPTNE